jgi:hypothetical protein
MTHASSIQGGIPPPDAMHSLLTGLPAHVLLLVLQQLDVVSLCNVARCNRALHRLSWHSSLWPASSIHTAADWALGDVKTTLAHILKLPPQVCCCYQNTAGVARHHGCWCVSSFIAGPCTACDTTSSCCRPARQLPASQPVSDFLPHTNHAGV